MGRFLGALPIFLAALMCAFASSVAARALPSGANTDTFMPYVYERSVVEGTSARVFSVGWLNVTLSGLPAWMITVHEFPLSPTPSTPTEDELLAIVEGSAVIAEIHFPAVDVIQSYAVWLDACLLNAECMQEGGELRGEALQAPFTSSDEAERYVAEYYRARAKAAATRDAQ